MTFINLIDYKNYNAGNTIEEYFNYVRFVSGIRHR
jgi:hypothetical protein